MIRPTLNPDEIFNQLVEMNSERAKEIHLEDEVRRLSNERKLEFGVNVLIVLCLFFGFSPMAQAKEYTDTEIVNAIRKAEGTWTYGIKSIKCSTTAECRQICFNTVRNNRKRFAKYGHKDHPDFISFLASRYCPIGAENDPTGLNKNWQKNVRYFLNKGA